MSEHENINFEKWLKENHPKKAMSTPDGYFDHFADELFSKINREEPVSTLKGQGKLRRLYLYSAAAVAACIIIAVLFIFPSDGTDDINFYVDLNDDSSWTYVMQNPENLSMEELASFPEAVSAIEDFEDEIFTQAITDEFIEDVDLDLLEDLYE